MQYQMNREQVLRNNEMARKFKFDELTITHLTKRGSAIGLRGKIDAYCPKQETSPIWSEVVTIRCLTLWPRRRSPSLQTRL